MVKVLTNMPGITFNLANAARADGAGSGLLHVAMVLHSTTACLVIDHAYLDALVLHLPAFKINVTPKTSDAGPCVTHSGKTVLVLVRDICAAARQAGIPPDAFSLFMHGPRCGRVALPPCDVGEADVFAKNGLRLPTNEEAVRSSPTCAALASLLSNVEGGSSYVAVDAK